MEFFPMVRRNPTIPKNPRIPRKEKKSSDSSDSSASSVSFARQWKFWLLTLSLVAPTSLFAAVPALATPDSMAVSRGDFLKAAVTMLHLPMPNVEENLPYKNLPADLKPYVQIAYDRHALRPFGTDLKLSGSLTRGQALQMAVALAGVTDSPALPAKYDDLVPNTPEANAVAVALRYHILRAVRPHLFGAILTLKGKEAKAILARLPSVAAGAQQSGSGSTVYTIPLPQPDQPLPQQDTFQQVWNMLQQNFLYKDRLDAGKATDKALQAYVQSLNDPYTEYLPKTSAESFNSIIQGHLEGIGASVAEQTGGLLTIVAPLKGSPALKAGLLAKDIILSADGVNLTGMPLDDAVSHVRGPKGTTVKLHIRRGTTEMDISVVRDTVVLPEIDVSYQGTVAVVQLLQFGETTHNLFRQEMQKIAQRHPTGLILDLRNNPGGLLTSAVDVLSNFLPQGTAVLNMHTRDASYPILTQDAPTIDPSVKIVLLVNGGSASASEIVAAALKDTKRATVLGAKTYGKGTAQTVTELPNGAELKETVEEFRSPKDTVINGVGVLPDEVMDIQPNGNDDPVMTRALQMAQ